VERLEIERDAGRLHPGQDGDERQLELGVEAVQPVLRKSLLERFANGEGGECLEPGPRSAVELGHGRQDQVELLGDDVGDRLAAERGVQDIRRDLGVERDRRRGGVRVVGDTRHEQRLDLVPDDRDLEPIEHPAQGRGIVRALDRDRATVAPRDRERERRTLAGARVVEQEPDTDRRLGRQPGFERLDPVAGVDLDPRRVGDRRGEGGREVARDVEGRRGDRRRRRRRRAVGRHVCTDGG